MDKKQQEDPARVDEGVKQMAQAEAKTADLDSHAMTTKAEVDALIAGTKEYAVYRRAQVEGEKTEGLTTVIMEWVLTEG